MGNRFNPMLEAPEISLQMLWEREEPIPLMFKICQRTPENLRCSKDQLHSHLDQISMPMPPQAIATQCKISPNTLHITSNLMTM